jgi:hypothetical protein
MTNASIGYSSKFEHGDGGSPEVWTRLAEVVTITPPSLQRNGVDATHMASPQRYREFIPGLKDPGEVSVVLNFIPGNTDQDILFSAFDADIPSNWRITYPNAEIWKFAAYCTGVTTAVPLDDKMTLTATFKVSGPPEFLTGP